MYDFKLSMYDGEAKRCSFNYPHSHAICYMAQTLYGNCFCEGKESKLVAKGLQFCQKGLINSLFQKATSLFIKQSTILVFKSTI